MKVFKKFILVLIISTVLLVLNGSYRASALNVGDSCDVGDNSLLGIPTWYKYLPAEGITQIVPVKGGGVEEKVVCQPTLKTIDDEKIPINNILLIVAAITEILIRIAGLAAFIFLIYGGFMYLTSSGNSENISKAGTTLLNAAIGLGIAISATAFINFFAGRLAQK